MSEQYIRVPKAALAKLKYLSRNSRAIYDFLCDSINSNKWNLNGYGAVYLSDIEAFTDIKCKNIYKNLDKIQELGLIHTIDFDELRGVKFFILYKKDYESDFEEIQKGNYLIKNNGIYILKSGNFLEYSLRKSHNKPSTQSQNTEESNTPNRVNEILQTEYNNTPNRVVNYSKQSTEILQTEYNNTPNRVVAPLLNKDIDSVSESPTKLPTKSITKFTTKPLTKGEVKEEVEEVGGVDLKKVVEEVEEKDFLELIKNLPPIDLPKPKVQVKEVDYVKSDLNKSSGGAAASFAESKPLVKPTELPSENKPQPVNQANPMFAECVNTLIAWGYRSKSANQTESVKAYVKSIPDLERLYKVIKSIEMDQNISLDRKASYVENRYKSDFQLVYDIKYSEDLESEKKAFKELLRPIYKVVMGHEGRSDIEIKALSSSLSTRMQMLRSFTSNPHLYFTKTVIERFDVSFKFSYETGKLDDVCRLLLVGARSLVPDSKVKAKALSEMEVLVDFESYFLKNFPKLEKSEKLQVSLFSNIVKDFIKFAKSLEEVQEVDFQDIIDSNITKYTRKLQIDTKPRIENLESIEDDQELIEIANEKVLSMSSFREKPKQLKSLGSLDFSEVMKGMK